VLFEKHYGLFVDGVHVLEQLRAEIVIASTSQTATTVHVKWGVRDALFAFFCLNFILSPFHESLNYGESSDMILRVLNLVVNVVCRRH
jgi:hypothetical protein